MKAIFQVLSLIAVAQVATVVAEHSKYNQDPSCEDTKPKYVAPTEDCEDTKPKYVSPTEDCEDTKPKYVAPTDDCEDTKPKYVAPPVCETPTPTSYDKPQYSTPAPAPGYSNLNNSASGLSVSVLGFMGFYLAVLLN